MKSKKAKRTVVTTEAHQVTIIRPAAKLVHDWCHGCQAPSDMAGPEQAALLLGITPREVYRRVENGEIHFRETEGGKLLICCRQLKGLEG